MSPIPARDIVPGELTVDDPTNVAVHALVPAIKSERDSNVLTAEANPRRERRAGAVGRGCRKAMISKKSEDAFGFGNECGRVRLFHLFFA